MSIEKMAKKCNQRIGQFIDNAVEFPVNIFYMTDKELKTKCEQYYQTVKSQFEKK